MKKIYNIADLIVGNYFDQLSQEQLDELNNWLDESEENKIFVKNLLSENNLQSALEVYKKDNKRNWRIIEKRIKAKQKVRKLYAVLKYAALLIIPLTFALLYNQLGKDSFNQQASHTITPGTTKATLILSDNSVVDLNTQNSESFDEFDGTKISKNNKQLLYTQSDLSAEELIEKYNTIRVPRGGEYQLILSDGTKVWLNSETELHYPVSFVKNKREVKLSGEAYFEVAKNTEKPFIVSFENERIEVLGTSFNIKCYKDEKNYQATLVEGKIKYHNESDELILTPNKQAEFNQETNSLVLKDVNSSDYIAWIKGRFIFSNQRLETILSSISRWYDTEVIYQDASLKDIRFTGKLKRYDKIEEILEILEATKKVKIYANNKSLTVKPV